MDHSEWTRIRKHLDETRSREKGMERFEETKNPNRILNGLLMMLILHNTSKMATDASDA